MALAFEWNTDGPLQQSDGAGLPESLQLDIAKRTQSHIFDKVLRFANDRACYRAHANNAVLRTLTRKSGLASTEPVILFANCLRPDNTAPIFIGNAANGSDASFVQCRGASLSSIMCYLAATWCLAILTALVACYQLLLRSKTRYYPAGQIIAEKKGIADGLMVITSGKVSAFISATPEFVFTQNAF